MQHNAQGFHREGARRRHAPLREVIPVDGEGTLYLDLEFGSLRVESHAEPVVAIEADATGWAAEVAHFSLYRRDNDVFFEAELERWLPALLGGARIRVRALIPRPYAVDAHSGGGAIQLREIAGRCAVDSGGGRIEIDGANGAVLAQTGGGVLRIRKVEGGVRARTAGGLIDVCEIGDDIEVQTLGGPIRVRDFRGRLDAETAAGPIVASFGARAEGSLKTAAGPIEVRLPRDASAELDARTHAGFVGVDEELPFAGRERGGHVTGRIGAGGARLVLRSAAGGIRVRARRESSRPEAASSAPQS